MSTLPSRSGIYQIVNSITQKRYIGLASNMRTRMNGHLYDLRKGTHSNTYLQKAWIKYGSNVFTFSCIQECIIQDLHLYEDYWVKVLKVLNREYGYNLKPTDPNGCSLVSKETRLKLSIRNKGQKPSKLCIQRRREVGISKEQIAIMTESRTHIDFKELHRRKRGKSVVDTLTGKLYGSLAEASEAIGMTKYKLSQYLRGTRTNKTTLKYI